MSEFGEHTLSRSAPDGWKVVPLGEALEKVVGGGTPARANPDYWKGSIPWLTVKDMRTRRPLDSIDHISESAVDNSSTNIIPADTVIIATRIGLGKVIRVPFPAAINQDLKALIPKEGIDKSYLEYWIYSIANYLESIGSGTTVKGIRLEQLKSLPFPIAPPDQQPRIVAEIEKQFSRLDEAIASLKRVKANLKRYKAAVLKAAVEGKLTEEWREQNPDVEPASKLLERILAERPNIWQEMVTICNRPKKYAEPVAVDAEKLPKLPASWVWAAADQISDFITKGTTPNKSKLTAGDGDIQFLKVYNLTFDGALNSSYKPAFVSQMTHDKDLARSKVFAGDVLINIVGPPLGQVSVVPSELGEANINQAIGRFRPVAPMSPAYLAMALRASSVMGRAIACAKTTAGQSNLTLAICRELPIPLPPEAEQVEIMAEADRLLSSTAGMERDVDGALKRAARLRQSVLSDALSGQLNGLSS